MRAIFVFSSLLLLILCQSSRAEAQADPAVAAARARQDAAKTIDLEFKCTEVIARGAFSHRDRAEPLADATNAVPREEATRESVNRIVIDGKSVRYEDNYSTLSRPDGSIQSHKSLILCDGNTTKTFISKAENINPFPQGFIDSAASPGAPNTMLLWPVMMTFRAVDPQFNPYPFAGLIPARAGVAIEGVECQEYESKSGTTVIRFWLDPTRDYLPRQISYRKAGVLRYQFDIAFERREPGNWIPVSWVWKEYFPSGNPLRTTRAEVVTLKLNEPQSPDQFDITFPPETRVSDKPKKKAYVVQSNGDMHEVSLGFTEIPNPVTIATQPGVRWFERYKWLLAGLGGILFLVGILLLIVWRKKHLTP